MVCGDGPLGDALLAPQGFAAAQGFALTAHGLLALAAHGFDLEGLTAQGFAALMAHGLDTEHGLAAVMASFPLKTSLAT